MTTVEVRRFTTALYAQVAELEGVAVDRLRTRDDRRGEPVRRWVAATGDEIVGAVTAWDRPDDRTFLQFAGDRATVAPLASEVQVSIRRPVHVMVDESDTGLLDAAEASGFVTEVAAERFRVGFAGVLRRLRRSWEPGWLQIASAADVDEAQLFDLDNVLRRDVPGSDGWRGDRDWFHDELAESPPFDRDAYLVAVDRRTGEFAGLVRVWRNPTGPRFGLVGVLPSYRHTPIAATLIRRALLAASRWGYDSFVTETSLSNAVIYPRLRSVQAESLGRFRQMVLR